MEPDLRHTANFLAVKVSSGVGGLFGGAKLASDSFDWNRDASQATFQNQVRADDALEAGNDHAATASFFELHQHDQVIAGGHDSAETDFVNTTETDHGGAQKIVLLSVVAGKLSDCFQHHHTGHQRHAGHVTANPEFIFRDGLVRCASVLIEILIKNRRQLFHFVPLRVVLANRIDVCDWLFNVQQSRVQDEFATCHDQVLIFLRFALRALALAGRLPWLAFFGFRWGLATVSVTMEEGRRMETASRWRMKPSANTSGCEGL